ncbi:oligosaccharide flippase family protein [Bacillus timonensis]|nr:oligosaccharide flippase family protein [Bacillus timonensis]
MKNSIGKNVLHLFLSTTLSRILNAVTLIILANYLNSQEYGMFSVALAFTMVMGYFTDVGLSNTVLREGSKQGANISSIISSYIKLRLVLLAFTFLAAYFIINWFYSSSSLAEIMFYLLIPMVIGLALQSIGIVYFQLVEQMHYLGLIRILSSIFLVGTVLFGMFMSVSPVWISFLFGFSYLLAGFYSITMVYIKVKLRFKDPFQKQLLTNIWSFVISGLLYMLLPQLGPIVLERTLPLALVGIFSVAYRIPSALHQVPGIIAGAFYPVLFRYFNHNQLLEHLKLNILQIKVMGLIGVVITIPFFHLSELVVTLLFGEELISAAEPLKLLSTMLVLQGMSIALADGLTTQALQTRRTMIQFFAVISGTILYYFFSLSNGVMGAVYAALCIEGIALFGFWLCHPSRWTIAKRGLFAYLALFSLILVGVHFILLDFPVIATITSYLLLLIVFIDTELREKLLHVMKKIKTHKLEKSHE